MSLPSAHHSSVHIAYAEAARHPALLTMPMYHGTLAAVRCFGERSVPVVLAESVRGTASALSRYTSERIRCPDVLRGPDALVDWLEQLGRTRTGMVLYPTSDEWAWTVSYGLERLRGHYHTYSPPLGVLRKLLDKSLLSETCASLSIPTPRTYLPRSGDETAALVARHGTLILKPRCQAFCEGPGKGFVVTDPDEAARVFHEYQAARYPEALLERCPDLNLPLLQEYVVGGAMGTYSVSGFIDRSGHILASLGSTKTRQVPPRAGVGLEFEEAPVRAAALAAIETLCRHVGYYGVFEVEFVPRHGAQLLVDFNPRYFGQMGFDIARGHPLPWLAHLCATGFEDEARALPLTPPAARPGRFVNRLAMGFEMLTSLGQPKMVADLATGLMRASRHGSPDATWSPSDPGPALGAAASLARWAVAHPLTMLRLMTRTQPK